MHSVARSTPSCQRHLTETPHKSLAERYRWAKCRWSAKTRSSEAKQRKSVSGPTWDLLGGGLLCFQRNTTRTLTSYLYYGHTNKHMHSICSCHPFGALGRWHRPPIRTRPFILTDQGSRLRRPRHWAWTHSCRLFPPLPKKNKPICENPNSWWTGTVFRFDILWETENMLCETKKHAMWNTKHVIC